jgi:hypothetical protein
VPGSIELDETAVASMLAFQYVLDGRSLLAAVTRRSWLDAVAGTEDGQERTLLAHYGRRVMTRRAAAGELLRCLGDELAGAFAGADRVTVLLSGGLDSRLSAAVLARLAREGRVTDDIRAVTWGIPESRDRGFGHRVARVLGMTWVPIDLGPADLVANVELAAVGLGALVSPVHLHGVAQVCTLDWTSRDGALVSSLGNGVGRGTYLWRHVSYARPLEPVDWLGLLCPDVAERAGAALQADLDRFRRGLGSASPIAVHECEMLAHFVSGQLLPVYGPLRRAAVPVHQSLSDPATYRFLWTLTPLLRTGALYRTALRLCWPEVADVPYALTNRPVRRLARSDRNALSPFTHHYPRWIAVDLAELLDEALAPPWWDSTGLFDGSAVRRAWRSIRHHPNPHPQTTYVLLWLLALRRLIEKLGVTLRDDGDGAGAGPRDKSPAATAALPWGFAGRPVVSPWRRLQSLPRQGLDIGRCHLPPNRAR